MEENLDFIFLGLSHGFINDFDKEKELIEEVKPEIVLSEEMENKKLISEEDYENFLKKKVHSFMTSFEGVEKLVNLCKEKKIKLIGIDLENFGFSKGVAFKIKKGKSFSPKEEIEINSLVKRREEIHLKKYFNLKGFLKSLFLFSWVHGI